MASLILDLTTVEWRPDTLRICFQKHVAGSVQKRVFAPQHVVEAPVIPQIPDKSIG